MEALNNSIKFTKERRNQLTFLDCGKRKTQLLMFDSHHPLEYKVGVIRTPPHGEVVPTNLEARDKKKKSNI